MQMHEERKRRKPAKIGSVKIKEEKDPERMRKEIEDKFQTEIVKAIQDGAERGEVEEQKRQLLELQKLEGFLSAAVKAMYEYTLNRDRGGVVVQRNVLFDKPERLVGVDRTLYDVCEKTKGITTRLETRGSEWCIVIYPAGVVVKET